MRHAYRSNVDAEFARLLQDSYGERPSRHSWSQAPRSVTLSPDYGTEVIGSGNETYQEYVVERGEPLAGAVPDPASVVVPAPAAPPMPVAEPQPAPSTGNDAAATPAITAPIPRTDNRGPAPALPLGPDVPPPSSTEPAHAAAAAPTPDAPPPLSTEPAPYGPAAAPAPATSPPPPATPPASPSGAGSASQQRHVSEDDLARDLQAILTGQKHYDGRTGTMVDKIPPGPSAPPVAVTPSNEHSIFDRIAESMQHAQAYDLGSIELSRRIQTWDDAADARAAQTTAYPSTASYGAAKPAAETAPPAPPRPLAPVGPGEFIRDLSAIEDRRALPFPLWSAASVVTDAASAVNIGSVGQLSGFSRPFFDTGEHVRAADDVGVVLLPVSGVPFSYGDLVAMPDFFESPQDLTGAGAAELAALRGLIRKSADFYRAGRGTNPVSDSDWNSATGGRYLALAAMNYSHFSPVTVIRESFAQRESDNRARYSQLHQQALRESQQIHLAHPQATPALETALIINAFADHFLTDAFASGHLVNKEYVISRFQSRFYSGANLSSAGEAFFESVAKKAFVGRVKTEFSKLEEAKPTIGLGDVGVRLNIDSPHMFTLLLQRAASQDREKISNIAVKVLHDHLNAAGVMVTNEAGAAPWRLFGDGNQDPSTLAVMRQAVQQSVANLSDPSLLASGVHLALFVDRVWRFVPVPTDAALVQLRTDIDTYTSPSSAEFSDAVAALITKQVDEIIKELIAKGHLRYA